MELTIRPGYPLREPKEDIDFGGIRVNGGRDGLILQTRWLERDAWVQQPFLMRSPWGVTKREQAGLRWASWRRRGYPTSCAS